MTKTKSVTKATAVLMAVITMFAVLSISAFARSYVEITSVNSVNSFNVTIDFNDCNDKGVRSTNTFELKEKMRFDFKFPVTTPQIRIEFYKGYSGTPSFTFTTPKYFSGMPSTLNTYIELEKGEYSVEVYSTESLKPVSGHFYLDSI